jgi:diguanylate cyclase (GGDEF)-like protein/PAS domain S-box-containing protein
LRESEQRYRTVADFTSDWEYWILPDGTFRYVSPSCEAVSGYSPPEFLADPQLLTRIIHPDDLHLYAGHLHGLTSQGAPEPLDYRIRAKNGEYRWISHVCRPVSGPAGQPLGVRASNRDITVRKQAEERLHLAASVFTHAREGIMITSADGTIVDVNGTFTVITGFTREEALGRTPRILSSGRQGEAFYAAMWRDLTEKGHWHGEVWNRRKSGEVYAEMQTISAVRDVQGHTRQYVAFFSDITALKEHEKQLEYLAHYDALTTLPNRVLLADRLRQDMAQAQRRGQCLAVAYLDLDDFKAMNDSHGHAVGDQLLTTLTARMQRALREGDTLARLGGDEFVAVMLDLVDVTASVPILSRLLAAAAQPVRIGDLVLRISASLGVTFYPQAESIDADQLLRQADQAMYQAKLAGKNRYHVFDPEHDRSVRGLHESLERIQRALTENEFELYYQPKVNMRTGMVIGAEALIRWRHPEKGLLPPGAFLPAVEDDPLSVKVGEWAIEAALAQVEIWHAAGLDLPVSVNVGARQLQQEDFVGRLRTLLAAHPDLEPDCLELEVLETGALGDLAGISRAIEACREIGVRFALDDFGTGYSSLTYLKVLPVSQIKIDRSFVRGMLEQPDDLAILEGVLGLATAFRREVIAEGVESEEHGEMLLRLGCELGQGFHIARPMLAGELPGWAAAWRPDASWLDCRAISRDALPLIFAIVEHRAWIVALESHLGRKGGEAPVLDHHQCRFGLWLDSESRYAGMPAFLAIEPLHRSVHELAAEICRLHVSGGASEAQAMLGALHGMKDALLEQLSAVIDKGQK